MDAEIPIFDESLRTVMTCAAYRDVAVTAVASHEQYLLTTGYEHRLIADDAFWILVLMKELQDAQ